MTAELTKDGDDQSAYRVEAIDEDGGCQVAIFSGPDALRRAMDYADSYYGDWADRRSAVVAPIT